jgi:hypothetical protein
MAHHFRTWNTVGMKNDRERLSEWWSSLSDSQRRAATRVTAYLPEWMAISLANAGVELVAISKRGTPRFSVTKSIRTFIGAQQQFSAS